MPCPNFERCALFSQLRLDSTLQVVKSNYCETDAAFKTCARFQASARGEPPPVGMMPSGKILPIFDAPSGVRAAMLPLVADVFARDEHFVVATIGQVLVTYWDERITSTGLNAAGAAADALLTKTDRYAVLNLVEDFIPLPTPRLQQEAAALMKKTGHAVACSATVLRGDSMWVRAARPLLSVMSKLALTSYPMGAFASVEEAAGWISKHLPTAAYPPATLASAIRDAIHRTPQAHASQSG